LNIGAYEKAAGVETLRYYYNDHLGSRRGVTDGSGTVLAKIDYSTWGLPTVTSSNGYDGTKDISYTGKEEDATGLYYFNARYYDPSIGRFITEDPIRSGLNWYAYCGNNPLSYTDPTGLVYEVGDDGHGGHIVCDSTGRLHATSGDSENRVKEYEKRERDEGRREAIDKAIKKAGSILAEAGTTALNLDYGNDSLANAKRDLASGNLAGASLNGLSAGMEAVYDAELASSKKVLETLGQISDWLGDGVRPIINNAGDSIFLSADGERRIQFHILNPAPHTFPHSHVDQRTPSGNIRDSKPIYPIDLPHF
jgi:RHS repeat-associated protein